MGLAAEVYASIGLGIVLLLLIIGIIVLILAKNGYFGCRISPSHGTNETIHDKPKLISYFSRSGTSLYSESTGLADHSSPRPEYKPGPEVNPIICLYDDIYYQPNTWTLSAADTVSTKSDTRKKRKKSKRRRRKSSQAKPPLPKKEPEVSKIDENDYEDIVVIPDTGIDIYTKYGHQDPYADWNTAFLPYI